MPPLSASMIYLATGRRAPQAHDHSPMSLSTVLCSVLTCCSLSSVSMSPVGRMLALLCCPELLLASSAGLAPWPLVTDWAEARTEHGTSPSTSGQWRTAQLVVTSPGRATHYNTEHSPYLSRRGVISEDRLKTKQKGSHQLVIFPTY